MADPSNGVTAKNELECALRSAGLVTITLPSGIVIPAQLVRIDGNTGHVVLEIKAEDSPNGNYMRRPSNVRPFLEQGACPVVGGKEGADFAVRSQLNEARGENPGFGNHGRDVQKSDQQGQFPPSRSRFESLPRGETPGHIAAGSKILAYSEDSGQYEDSTVISVDQKKQTVEVLIQKDQTRLKLPFVLISTRSSQLLNQQTSGRKCSDVLTRSGSEERLVGSNGVAKQAATQDDVLEDDDCVTTASYSSCEGDRFYFLDEGRIKLLGGDGARKFYAIPIVRKGVFDEETLVLLFSLETFEDDIQQLCRKRLRVLSEDRSYTITGLCKLEGRYMHYAEGGEDDEQVYCDGLISILVDLQYKSFHFVPGNAKLPLGDRGEEQKVYVDLLIELVNLDGKGTHDLPLKSTEKLEELLSVLYSVAVVIHDEMVVQSARSVLSDSSMSILGDERPEPSSLIRALKPRVPRDSLDVSKARLHTKEKSVSDDGAIDDTGHDVEMTTEGGTGTEVV